MLENLKMLVWNVRGLNSKARRIAIRALVATTNASIVCFQETKINLFYSGLILETLGAEFDDFVYLPADGTRGGILLAWQSRTVAITDPIFTTNILTAKVHIAATAPWWLSVVYGPQEEADKVEFLREIRELRPNCPGPWMICGDFNLIYRDEDKNNNNLDRRMMGRFRRCINDLALKEIYLSGRRYTWTNGQDPPTLVLLDRVLCTSDWEELAGECSLRCLASVVSDHIPLLLDCSPTPPVHRRFHFEEFWIRLQGFQEVVAEAWASVGSADPYERLMLRLQATASKLTSWAAKLVGNVRHKLAICRELILRFDKAREDRTLTPHDICCTRC
jgi:exonuclease III